MFKIKNKIEFDMAHYLSDYNGKCANIHGHRYKLITSICKEELCPDGHARGMVEDFSVIKNALKDIETMFDHKLLIEDNADGRRVAESLKALPNGFEIVMLPFRPTCEEMSRYIFNSLKAKGLPVSEVELFETPNNSCVYNDV
ncbi:MAG: 6-carboxytetrahydropterin synthase [Paludibacteraceae bacterium]|nr:6-carboxytetrahydropterin synthase [Paludibacteraceae bacterium]